MDGLGLSMSLFVSFASFSSVLAPPRPAAHSRFFAFLYIIRWRTIVLFGWHLLRLPN